VRPCSKLKDGSRAYNITCMGKLFVSTEKGSGRLVIRKLRDVKVIGIEGQFRFIGVNDKPTNMYAGVFCAIESISQQKYFVAESTGVVSLGDKKKKTFFRVQHYLEAGLYSFRCNEFKQYLILEHGYLNHGSPVVMSGYLRLYKYFRYQRRFYAIYDGQLWRYRDVDRFDSSYDLVSGGTRVHISVANVTQGKSMKHIEVVDTHGRAWHFKIPSDSSEAIAVKWRSALRNVGQITRFSHITIKSIAKPNDRFSDEYKSFNAKLARGEGKERTEIDVTEMARKFIVEGALSIPSSTQWKHAFPGLTREVTEEEVLEICAGYQQFTFELSELKGGCVIPGFSDYQPTSTLELGSPNLKRVLSVPTLSRNVTGDSGDTKEQSVTNPIHIPRIRPAVIPEEKAVAKKDEKKLADAIDIDSEFTTGSTEAAPRKSESIPNGALTLLSPGTQPNEVKNVIGGMQKKLSKVMEEGSDSLIVLDDDSSDIDIKQKENSKTVTPKGKREMKTSGLPSSVANRRNSTNSLLTKITLLPTEEKKGKNNAPTSGDSVELLGKVIASESSNKRRPKEASSSFQLRYGFSSESRGPISSIASAWFTLARASVRIKSGDGNVGSSGTARLVLMQPSDGMQKRLRRRQYQLRKLYAQPKKSMDTVSSTSDNKHNDLGFDFLLLVQLLIFSSQSSIDPYLCLPISEVVAKRHSLSPIDLQTLTVESSCSLHTLIFPSESSCNKFFRIMTTWRKLARELASFADIRSHSRTKRKEEESRAIQSDSLKTEKKSFLSIPSRSHIPVSPLSSIPSTSHHQVHEENRQKINDDHNRRRGRMRSWKHSTLRVLNTTETIHTILLEYDARDVLGKLIIRKVQYCLEPRQFGKLGSNSTIYSSIDGSVGNKKSRKFEKIIARFVGGLDTNFRLQFRGDTVEVSRDCHWTLHDGQWHILTIARKTGDGVVGEALRLKSQMLGPIEGIENILLGRTEEEEEEKDFDVDRTKNDFFEGLNAIEDGLKDFGKDKAKLSSKETRDQQIGLQEQTLFTSCTTLISEAVLLLFGILISTIYCQIVLLTALFDLHPLIPRPIKAYVILAHMRVSSAIKGVFNPTPLNRESKDSAEILGTRRLFVYPPAVTPLPSVLVGRVRMIEYLSVAVVSLIVVVVVVMEITVLST